LYDEKLCDKHNYSRELHLPAKGIYFKSINKKKLEISKNIYFFDTSI